ncbi:uncharacterized protein PHACADRAFT_206228 [Phanerochaete carnosa HHB-10118-sp]|uniref:Uncharacterized protein n=1 Tax=Phanerochaete carnosa (strain HHB-10118-sp) TaxID=650164 RepID=K5WLF6_PHACS|nr:uncharacterized protein PHACADRAFT_206228 [Phanerochaete carnosa HHB-10118-sp]EKM60019.1 hypothetical protein PHACADRAFT_206228 [Phanerochaete carnosa HHB-10118-sp]
MMSLICPQFGITQEELTPAPVEDTASPEHPAPLNPLLSNTEGDTTISCDADNELPNPKLRTSGEARQLVTKSGWKAVGRPPTPLRPRSWGATLTV